MHRVLHATRPLAFFFAFASVHWVWREGAGMQGVPAVLLLATTTRSSATLGQGHRRSSISCHIPHVLLLPELQLERTLHVEIALALALDPLLVQIAHDALVHGLGGC